MTSQHRADILLAPAVIGSLLLLAINDHILKAVFGNFLTGKLSDFAGLFAIVAIATAAAQAARAPIAIAIASAFVFWKAPASELLIARWNALGLWPVARTVDFTDLTALAVVPFAVAYGAKFRRRLPLRPSWRLPARLAAGGLAVIIFAATSYQSPVEYHRTYKFEGSPEALVRELESSGVKAYQDGATGEYELWIPSDFCFDYVFADVAIRANGPRSLLMLYRITHHCPRRNREKEDLQAIFVSKVATPAHLQRVD